MTHRHAIAIIVAAAGAAATVAAQQPPDRAAPPMPGPTPALHLPAIQKRQLSNGLPVWIVEQHDVPVAQVNLVVLSGSADDPAGKFGVASLTTAMLEEGAGSRSALEIADAVDFLGADLGTSSGSDSSAVRLHVPVARLAGALPIMGDVALRPTFPKDELERLRQQRLTSLLQSRDDPATIAALAFSRVLYGPAHRYGTATAGTAETIKAFTPEDLRTFYASAFRADNASLLVVGDTTPNAVTPLLESTFGGWKGSGTVSSFPAAAAKRLPAAEQPAKRAVYLVDKPDAAQSQIRIGWIGVPRSTPDYFPLQVMNSLLGGSFSSRLNNNLREKHGYTYGASSAFDMRASAGPFTAFAGVQTDKTADALKEFFNELNGILQPVPADEVARAKNYVALRYPSAFETTGDISRRLEDMLIYHLPENYFSSYVQNIQAVTAADVQRVAQKYIQPGRFAVVIVGDLKATEPAVRALNLGPIKVLKLDDVFGPAPSVQASLGGPNRPVSMSAPGGRSRPGL
jgi:zinc protease